MLHLLFADAWVHMYSIKIKSKAFMNHILKIKLHACNLSIDHYNLILLI